MRTAFVSVNLFSLLCDGTTPVTASSLGDSMRYGGPILYLCVDGFILFGILMWATSGSIIPRRSRQPDTSLHEMHDNFEAKKQDVAAEARAVARSSDALCLLHLIKSFDDNKVVDDVSYRVSRGTIFAMLGPNGAGKTTIFNMICM